MSFVDHYLLYFRQRLISPSAFPAVCLLKVHMEINSLLSPPSLVCLQHLAPFAVCQFSIGCFLSFVGEKVSLPK
jgi:hypothetical protein